VWEEDNMILLVDDSKIIRHILQGKLTEAGFSCREAVDGIDALEQFRNCRPPIVLLDLTMPDMSGLTVLRLMKDLDKDVKIIVCTYSSRHEVVFKAMQLGAVDYVIKPFQTNEVIVKINRLLSNQIVKGVALC
jgi:two-component system, chemotaxis family, chemotaxis protein CheY